MKLGKLKVAQMRKELEARGLDISGTRPALMKRLRAALELEEKAADEPAPNLTHASAPKRNALTNEAQHGESKGGQHAEEASNPVAETERGGDREIVRQATGESDTYEEPISREHGAEESADGDAAAQDVDVAGSFELAARVSMEERLRKRRERFGAVEQDPAGEKGSVTKAKRPAEEKLMEDIMRRRVAKFGPVGAGKEVEAKWEGLTEEERERRVKRQRRFQSMGSATAV